MHFNVSVCDETEDWMKLSIVSSSPESIAVFQVTKDERHVMEFRLV